MRRTLGSLILLGNLIFASPVFAGGGPVYIDVGSSLSSWNSEYRNIIAKVHLHPDVPCIGTKITFKYEDQKDGDSVATGADGNTYVIKEVGGRWLNGKSVYDCGTYAKYASKNRELKYAVIVVSTPKGETYERKVALNFQSNEPIISLGDSLPWDSELFPQTTNNPAPSGNINAWVLNQQLDELTNRQVTVKWSAFDGYSGTFSIYGRLASNKNNWDKLLDGQRGPSATVNIKADEDYYIKVQGCQDKIGTCADSNILLLPKLQKQDGKVIIPPISTGDNDQVEELNKKVENLQTQLDQSKKIQSVLEQRINDLINFIKRLFPFFK